MKEGGRGGRGRGQKKLLSKRPALLQLILKDKIFISFEKLEEFQ